MEEVWHVREIEDKMLGPLNRMVQSRPGGGVCVDSHFMCLLSCRSSLASLQHGDISIASFQHDDISILYFDCFRPIFFSCC